MQRGSWDRVEDWWADLFGCAKALLWQGVSVRPHAGLGSYQGVFVAGRPSGCHVSLPACFKVGPRESLGQKGKSQLLDPRFWRALRATSGLSVLGPSMHSYTDHDPGPAEDVELVDARELASFRSMVDDQDWEEGGFAGDVIEVFVLRETSGQIVAAAASPSFWVVRPTSGSWCIRPAGDMGSAPWSAERPRRTPSNTAGSPDGVP